MFHKHAIAHAHNCLYTSGQPKRAKNDNKSENCSKIASSLLQTLKKIDKYRQHLFGKKSRYRYDSKYRNSTTFGRVLLLNVLLGLWIKPVLAADCGKHLCILPCTRSACETV